MAGEISLSINLRCNNGEYDYQRVITNTVDQTTAAGGVPGFQNIGTSHELITGLTDMTAEGYCIAKNLDGTNYCDIGVDVGATFYPLIKLKAGESCLFRLSPTVAVYARANTAAVDLLFETLED